MTQSLLLGVLFDRVEGNLPRPPELQMGLGWQMRRLCGCGEVLQAPTQRKRSATEATWHRSRGEVAMRIVWLYVLAVVRIMGLWSVLFNVVLYWNNTMCPVVHVCGDIWPWQNVFLCVVLYLNNTMHDVHVCGDIWLWHNVFWCVVVYLNNTMHFAAV